MDEKREEYQKETRSDPLNIPDRSQHQYKTETGDQVSEADVHGNPNLIYVSQFLEGWEPSGVPVRLMPPQLVLRTDQLIIVKDAVEVTRCTGVQS